jgi:flavin-dependent thymidylate synthase
MQSGIDNMKILLAGYNVDSTVLEELKTNHPSRKDITPETLSAAYARISRDPRSVDELRAVARAEVERARRSNRNIIFKMGHHSVAEHAVFNFDVIGISRLAIEEIEKFRLCSYTEKSQRYIKLEDDYLLPEEIKQAGREEQFVALIHRQNRGYHDLYAKLQHYFFETHPEMAADPKRRATLDGWAKEDARYVLSLATLGQLGMTLNARNLEHMIRRLASHPLTELREFNRRIYELAKQVAPSIILFTEANDYDARAYGELGQHSQKILSGDTGAAGTPVRLVDSTQDADDRLAAALLHSGSSRGYQTCLEKARSLSRTGKLELVKTALQRMEFYDAVPREFEYVTLTFELVVSATCFAQLKRHRLATLTVQPYDLELGVVVPPSIEAVGARDEFMRVLRETEEFFRELKHGRTTGAEYALSNAHSRRVLWKTNAREFYHFSRLREDATAQWDIRLLAAEMTRQAVQVMPLTLLLIGGKDAYPETYAAVFGRRPKIESPPF